MSTPCSWPRFPKTIGGGSLVWRERCSSLRESAAWAESSAQYRPLPRRSEATEPTSLRGGGSSWRYVIDGSWHWPFDSRRERLDAWRRRGSTRDSWCSWSWRDRHGRRDPWQCWRMEHYRLLSVAMCMDRARYSAFTQPTIPRLFIFCHSVFRLVTGLPIRTMPSTPFSSLWITRYVIAGPSRMFRKSPAITPLTWQETCCASAPMVIAAASNPRTCLFMFLLP